MVSLKEFISFYKRNRKIWLRTVFDYISDNTYPHKFPKEYI